MRDQIDKSPSWNKKYGGGSWSSNKNQIKSWDKHKDPSWNNKISQNKSDKR